ncbi:MAG TPA: glycosyltransferase family 39 protein [Candidatus Krumholzibacteria bacterium]|nr:glycosyltransferase family 39 protein [Candidatus Krumholzibacteria bacterium]
MRTIFLIMGLAFVVRLAAVLWLSDTVPFSDYLYYHMAGEKIASNWGFLFDSSQVEVYGKFGWWPPLYPVFIGALYSLFSVEHRIVVFVQILLGTLACGLVYRLGKRLGGENAGRIAGGLVAIHPTYVFATNLLASENLFVVWLLLGLLCVTLPPSRRTFAGAGILFGLAALTRASGLVLPAVAGFWLLARAKWRRPGWIACAWMLGACSATIAPWTLRNTLVVGSPAIVCYGGGLNFYFGHNAEGIGYRDLSLTPMADLTTQAAIDRTGYRLAWAYIGTDPAGFVSRGVRKVVALFGSPRWAPHDNSAISLPEGWTTNPDVALVAEAMRAKQRAKNRWLDGFFTWIAAAIGKLVLCGGIVAAVRWKKLGTDAQLLVYLCLGWIGAHVFFWAQPRFRYPIEIFLILLTALAMAQLWTERTRSAMGRK